MESLSRHRQNICRRKLYHQRLPDAGGHPDKILLLAGSYHGPSVQAEYEFWVKAPGASEYSRVSAYSTRSWTEYAAAEHGTYQFRVNARIVGSSADFERYYECSVDF